MQLRHPTRKLTPEYFARPISRDPVIRARHQILEVATHFCQHRNPNAKALGRRHLNQAVCIVRRNRLVRPDVLETAGFHPTEPIKRKKRKK